MTITFACINHSVVTVFFWSVEVRHYPAVQNAQTPEETRNRWSVIGNGKEHMVDEGTYNRVRGQMEHSAIRIFKEIKEFADKN